MDRPSPPADRIRNAVSLLIEEIRERLERHPQGHLVSGRPERVDLRISLPAARRDGLVELVSEGVAASLTQSIQALLVHSAVFQPGRVLCLRCASASCEHSAPTAARQVFAGWGPTGLPRFLDFGAWLLQRREPRVDLLYREIPERIALLTPEAEIEGALIPAFRQHDSGYRIHGQVAAGWFRAPGTVGRVQLAMTFQVISFQPNGNRPRFGLNVVGTGPEGEPLEALFGKPVRSTSSSTRAKGQSWF